MGPGKLACVLAAALVLAPACVQAQVPVWRARQQMRQERRQERAQQQERQKQQQEARAAQGAQNQPGHAGDWLRRYKDLPPDQQRRSLENDPQFKKLPPPRQAELLRRLQRFSSLPPQRQEQILNRMETWEHLTVDQKKE